MLFFWCGISCWLTSFFPARVALNDICCGAVRGTRRFFPPMRGNHTCSWWRCSQRTCAAIPGLDMKNCHTLDGLAVPNRQFCRAFWRQVGSHVSLLWRSQQFFSSRQPRHGLPGTRILPGCEHRLMSPTSFRNWSISREVPFDQVGATCQVGSRHGSCGPWGGADTPLGPPGCMSRRTVPRDWLQHHPRSKTLRTRL